MNERGQGDEGQIVGLLALWWGSGLLRLLLELLLLELLLLELLLLELLLLELLLLELVLLLRVCRGRDRLGWVRRAGG
jgi:hypothetical protein